MQTYDTLTDRLHAMKTDDPHGEDAERLLRRLAILQDAFWRDDMRFTVSSDMSLAQITQAFATLRQWHFIRKISRKRFVLPKAVKQLFHLSDDEYLAHFTVLMTSIFIENKAWLPNHWRDMVSSLAWAIQYHPKLVEKMGARCHPPQYWGFEWPLVLQAVCEMREAWPEVVLSNLPEAWYDDLEKRYVALKTPEQQAWTMYYFAHRATLNKDLTHARYYWEQAMARQHALRHTFWSDVSARLDMLYLLAAQKDRAAVYRYAQQLVELDRPDTSQFYYFHHLARIMIKIGDHASARHYFQAALRAGFVYDVLRDWGKFEYGVGNIQAGEAFYEMAKLDLMDWLEEPRPNWGQREHQALWGRYVRLEKAAQTMKERHSKRFSSK